MKMNRLGRSGLVVSEICMGTMTFGSMADEPTSIKILDKSYDAGVNFIDVAEMYPVPPNKKWAGRSEEICGRWLEGRPRDSVIVATKVVGPTGGWFQGPVRSGNTGLDRWNIEKALDDSLRRLGTDYVDLYQTHWPDPDFPIEHTLEALDRVVQAGKVRYVGCSNQSAYGLTKSLWAADVNATCRYETIQNNFSILNRRFSDELSEVCRREQVSLLPYSPLAGGVLTGKYKDGAWPEGSRFSGYKNDPARGEAMAQRFVNPGTLESTDRFAELAKELDMTVATLATAWSLKPDYVGATIIGATHPDQLDETLAAAGVVLPPETLQAIDRISSEIKYPMG
jgi:aryl-alcohol dehydrogenase-like predicted oxidoreductase